MSNLRIGIPTALYNNTFGLDVRYIEWCSQFGTPILLTPFIDQYDLFDVLFLPGGADVAEAGLFNQSRSNPHLEWFDSRYIYRCIQDEKPIVAICRGFQQINLFFNGTLRNLYGEELKLHQQNQNETLKNSLVHKANIVHRIYKSEEPEFLHDINTIKVNSIHHQAIDKLGNGLEVLARDGDVIEVFKHKKYPIVGFQYHPEKIWDKLSKQAVENILW